MNLSEAQLRPLWTLLAAAWAAHCRTSGERVTDSKAKEAWRRETLRRETGFDSLTRLPRAGRHYVTFMAALEVIAANGVRWQLALHGADARPYHHAITKLIEDHGLAEEYVEGIVCTVLRCERETLPGWGAMTVEQLAHILGALKRTCASPKFTREVAA
jgi:hypothetical protein